MKFLPAVICTIAVTAASADAAEWYVTANGSDSGAGTQASPLSLTKALSSSSPARAGDTIWLRGGTYNSSYTSNLNGTASAPIVVRAYQGERVVLDANNCRGPAADVVLSINRIPHVLLGIRDHEHGPVPLDDRRRARPERHLRQRRRRTSS